MRDRLVHALDYDNLAQAHIIVEKIAPYVGVMKVGLELFTKEGPGALELVQAHGCKVFLDLKLHDIPATVGRASKIAKSHEVDYITVHASGGEAMVQAAVDVLGPERVLAVTALTSLDQESLLSIYGTNEAKDTVLRLKDIAYSGGARGFVCSPLEVGELRAILGWNTTLVVPGIRPASVSAHDQKRIATPSFAMKEGASMIVVGRAIRDAEDPASAAKAILEEMESTEHPVPDPECSMEGAAR